MKRIFIMTMLVIASAMFFWPSVAVASDDGDQVDDSCQNSFLGIPHWYKYLVVERETLNSNKTPPDTACQVTGPKAEGSDNLDISKVVTRVALAVIDILLRVAGMVAFVFIVYSGFRFVMSQGNSDQETAARETAINALIGMVITIFAIAIVTFIGRQLT